MIDPALCAAMIEKFDRDPRRRPGETEGGYSTSTVKLSVDLGISGPRDWQPLRRSLDEAVGLSLRRYRADVPNFGETHLGLLRETSYQIQSYQPNGKDGFPWHSDIVNRSNSERVLTMIGYLNTVEVGGETEFRAQELKVAPRCGTILWFPPAFPYVHRGNTPVSGPKYIVTCFLVYPK